MINNNIRQINGISKMERLLMKTVSAALMLSSAFLLGACDTMSNKATPERLDALLQTGVKPERQSIAEELLANALGRQNSIAGLAQLGDSAVENPVDVALNEVMRASLERNPDIADAAQDINRADAQRLAAIFGYLPQVSANVTMSNVKTTVVESDNQVFQLGSATYPVLNYGVELRQPILNLGKIYAIQLASTVQTTTEVAYVAAVQKALFDTFDAYLIASVSRARIDELGRRAGLLASQATREAALTDSGLNDALTIRALLAEQARVQGDASVETARYAEALGTLSYLTGTAISGVKVVSVPQGVMGTERRTTPAQAIAAAQESNPELLVTAMQVVQSDLSRKRAIATDFSPVLDLFARYEQEDREGSRFGGGSVTQDTTTGVQLKLPILNGNGDGLRTVEANVDLRSGVVNYHATKRRLETEITMTLQRMAQLSKAMGQMSSAAQQASENVTAEQGLIADGQSSELQLVSRQVLESQLREAAAVQRIEYLRAWARLQYLTGAMSVDAAL